MVSGIAQAAAGGRVTRPTAFASGVASRPVMPPSGDMGQRVRMLREGEAKMAAARRQRVLDAAVNHVAARYAGGPGWRKWWLHYWLSAAPHDGPGPIDEVRATFARLMAEESKR